jgi:hypothetical protein
VTAPDLSSHIGDIARRLFGEPNKALSRRTQLRFGSNGSLAVEIGGPKAGSWFDHEHGIGGGSRDLLRIKGGLSDADIHAWLERELGIRPERSANGHDPFRIVKTYDYRDEGGKLLFQVCRLHPKDFRQRRPDGGGGWDWKTQGIRKVLYRLPELVAAAANVNGKPWRVFIVEGEKDADRMAQWGLTVTTNPGGAGKWRKEFNRYFVGADVVVIPDNDVVGRAHVRDIAVHLAPVAACVRVLELKGLSAEGDDTSDWIQAGGTQSDLETLVETTPPFEQAAGDADLPPPGTEDALAFDFATRRAADGLQYTAEWGKWKEWPVRPLQGD